MRMLPLVAALVVLGGCGASDSARGPAESAAGDEIRPDAAGCYPTLPAPQIHTAFAWTQNGFDDYAVFVSNWRRYPDALFAPAPDLAPCGLNRNASRTWVEMFRPDGQRIYGYCALTSSEEFGKSMYYMLPAGTPGDAYIVLWDRRCDRTYRSAVAVPGR